MFTDSDPLSWKLAVIQPKLVSPMRADQFPDSYKRIHIAFIESRKRHGKIQFQKSLEHFIDMIAKNKRFSFVKEMS